MSYNTGVQKGLSKLNQQFNQILVSNARILDLKGFPNTNFNIDSNNGYIILNKNIKIDTSGILEVGSSIKFENLELKRDDNDLIWDNNVIITDSSLQSELDNLGYNKLKLLPLGSIIQYPKTAKKIPKGWRICNGDKIEKNKYPNLKDILEETDQHTYYQLPLSKNQYYFDIIFIDNEID